MKNYTRKPRLSEDTIRKLMHNETIKKGIYEYSVEKTRNGKLRRFDKALFRWNDAVGEYECWMIGAKGLYEFEVD